MSRGRSNGKPSIAELIAHYYDKLKKDTKGAVQKDGASGIKISEVVAVTAALDDAENTVLKVWYAPTLEKCHLPYAIFSLQSHSKERGQLPKEGEKEGYDGGYLKSYHLNLSIIAVNPPPGDTAHAKELFDFIAAAIRELQEALMYGYDDAIFWPYKRLTEYSKVEFKLSDISAIGDIKYKVQTDVWFRVVRHDEKNFTVGYMTPDMTDFAPMPTRSYWHFGDINAYFKTQWLNFIRGFVYGSDGNKNQMEAKEDFYDLFE